MNKQEAIRSLQEMAQESFEIVKINAVHIDNIVEVISQIDEPQKVVVPKFVADFYESIKDDFEDKVYEFCLQFNRDIRELSGEVCGWFVFEKNEPIQTLVKMKLYGYTVEKEKLYTVEIPDPHGMYKIRYLFRSSVGNILIGGNDYRDIFLNAETHLTESEIKKDFEWAWQWAKEVE